MAALDFATLLWRRRDTTPAAGDAMISIDDIGAREITYIRRGGDCARLSPEMGIGPAAKHTRELAKLRGSEYAANANSCDTDAASYNAGILELRSVRPRNRRRPNLIVWPIAFICVVISSSLAGARMSDGFSLRYVVFDDTTFLYFCLFILPFSRCSIRLRKRDGCYGPMLTMDCLRFVGFPPVYFILSILDFLRFH